MNKKSIYFGGLLLAALTLSSCASDDTATEKTAGKDTPKTGTVFSSEAEPATRTSATYTGSGLDFYWTASDKIWVKDDNGTYRQSSDDDINTRIAAVPGSTTTDKAKFWVNGSYTGTTHKVRYTGKNGTKDKVTIKASQTQNTPNEAAHIADDGDFGIADATGSGKYSFTLNHKAAYVTFMPYNANGVIPGAKIQKIRIYTSNTSDQLAGTFDVADNGTLSNGTTTSNSVELNVNDFTLPSAYSYTTNGATMVLNPGTYSNVTIEYTLHDAGTNVTGTVKKTYPSVTFDAGKNTPVKSDLKIKVYHGNEYYMWDAVDPYWKGYEWNNPNTALRFQPIVNGQSDPAHAPQSTETASAHTSRDYNDMLAYNDPTGVASPVTPAHSAKDCPNLNELYWYGEKGESYWDNTTLWATMDHLYVGGMWFLKQSAIASKNGKNISDLKLAAPDGIDYTRKVMGIIIKTYSISTGIPSNLNDYFYYPALGIYNSLPTARGEFVASGTIGCMWSSTLAQNAGGTMLMAFMLRISSSDIQIYPTYRNSGLTLFNSSNEDEYRPF